MYNNIKGELSKQLIGGKFGGPGGIRTPVLYKYYMKQYIKFDKLVSPINGKSYKCLNSRNIKNFGFNSIEELHSLYPNFPLICEKSSNKIKNSLTQDKKLEEKVCGECNTTHYKPGIFCSQSCSTSFSNRKKGKRSEKTKNKISQSLRKTISLKYCLTCNEPYLTKRYIRKYCSNKCARYSIKVYKIYDDAKLQYTSDCQFKFNLGKYPNEFDFNLIEKFGWYNPVNNNNGVSRDHMISIKYGYENNIDPRIISHPANCKIMKQNNNASKGSDCSISLDELLNRIEEWNIKYMET